MSSILERAIAWAEGDCDESNREELQRLIRDGDEAALRELVDGELAFGTAGLRAKVGPGSLRMNRAVVRRTTRAVADELIASHPDARGMRPVVVGYDGRLSSRSLAEEVVAVLGAAGLRVRYFTEPVPTPLVAFALRKYQAIAAVVVTASHNPADYNGYKLYAANGAQIISPRDHLIAKRIATIGRAREIRVLSCPFSDAHDSVEPVQENIVDSYFREIDALRPASTPARDLKIVYTAMHGVGYRAIRRAFSAAGFQNLIPVAQQVEPDGDFPTTKFPNPEEPGALDIAMNLAEREQAVLVLANDPDADRLAACARTVKDELKRLTGNQVGILLADYLLSHYEQQSQALVVSSIVSSPMLRSVAGQYGAHFEETFTGFKWIWNAVLELREEKDLHFVFGFEEALGYSIEDIVRDKDGVSAALVFAEMAAELHALGSSVFGKLEELYRRHGLWVSFQKSVSCDERSGPKLLSEAMERLAADPPTSILGEPVTGLVDFRKDSAARPRWLSEDNLLQFSLQGGGRLLVRPSGTEPKLKIYVDLCRTVAESDDVWSNETSALAHADLMATELVRLLQL